MKIRNSSDWRDAIPFDTPLRASEAVPGEATRCATCGPSSEVREREELWVVKHRHPNNPAGFVRLYCLAHRPVIATRPEPVAKAPRERRAPRAASSTRVAAPTVPERPAVFCPDCFVEVPATGVCGMCGQRVG
ncbi:glucose-6-phosphate dehydrogenase [Microbacterium sp. PA5]|uniref:glucose-6-phosphate dehydrogenase n=1 Tax=Microbacterium sp. PA5 TaxID=3416654 RepID=UPI003CF61369